MSTHRDLMWCQAMRWCQATWHDARPWDDATPPDVMSGHEMMPGNLTWCQAITWPYLKIMVEPQTIYFKWVVRNTIWRYHSQRLCRRLVEKAGTNRSRLWCECWAWNTGKYKRSRGVGERLLPHPPRLFWLAPVPRARCCHSKRRACGQTTILRLFSLTLRLFFCSPASWYSSESPRGSGWSFGRGWKDFVRKTPTAEVPEQLHEGVSEADSCGSDVFTRCAGGHRTGRYVRIRCIGAVCQ